MNYLLLKMWIECKWDKVIVILVIVVFLFVDALQNLSVVFATDYI